MKAKTSKELFSFLAKQIEAFLKEHHSEHYTGHKTQKRSGEKQQVFDMGFTFSFPVQQVSINKGYLIRWTKGFDINDTVGKDVCGLLQTEIDALQLPVRVSALVNDTVGTLMARGYTSPGKSGTLLGAIFGTGTNGAYVERVQNITKMADGKEIGNFDTSTGVMVINTEWGSFDNELRTLPNTPYDASLDADTPNPGIQMFEKRISGMYLGEILRRALLSLIEDPDVPLFHYSDATCINKDSELFKTWGIDSSFLSTAAGDVTPELRITRQAIEKEMNVDSPSAEDAAAVRLIAKSIGKRAARLAAVAVGAIVIASGKLNSKVGLGEEVADEDMVDIGVDGSLVEFYPGFEQHMREALREIVEIGLLGEKRIRLGIAKDGSGVGAALIALVAGQSRVAS